MKEVKSALVIGNGESRSSVDLANLRQHATLIGCNAIHRDIIVDHLVCCDNRMVAECLHRKKSRKLVNIYTRERYFLEYQKLHKNERVKLLPQLPYSGNIKPDQPEHWGSGPYAVLLACDLNFDHIHLIGFDLYGKNHLVNNVYKNSTNYLKETAAAVDPSYWIYQIRKIFVYYPDRKFFIYNLPEWQLPTEWQLPNVHLMDINNLCRGLA